MENNSTFIHIGYPKTGSTTIQRKLFSKLPNLDLVGQPASIEDVMIREVIHAITDCESLEYDAGNLVSKIKKLKLKSEKLLLTEETFSTGSSLTGRVDRMEIAHRLNYLFPDAKIIVVLREQTSIIRSFYLQKRKIDPSFSVPFDDWLEQAKQNAHKENVFQYFDYEKLLTLYKKLFGKKNILVLTYEDLLSDDVQFLCRILEFMGYNPVQYKDLIKDISSSNENKTVTKRTLYLRVASKRLKLLAKVIPKPVKDTVKSWSMRGRPFEVHFTEKQRQMIRLLYGKSNRSVTLEWSLNLKEKGYSVSDE
ncbi:sulfotransferase [Marinobacter nauticus]